MKFVLVLIAFALWSSPLFEGKTLAAEGSFSTAEDPKTLLPVTRAWRSVAIYNLNLKAAQHTVSKASKDSSKPHLVELYKYKAADLVWFWIETNRRPADEKAFYPKEFFAALTRLSDIISSSGVNFDIRDRNVKEQQVLDTIFMLPAKTAKDIVTKFAERGQPIGSVD
jgi:hypothetical protein